MEKLVVKARTRISEFCRSSASACPAAGFTLIEMVVVLAVVSLLAGVAVLPVGRLVANSRADAERADMERRLRQLPLAVRDAGSGGVLGVTLAFPLPAGWTLSTPAPVVYHYTGACDGGEVILDHPPRRWRYELTPPVCKPRLVR